MRTLKNAILARKISVIPALNIVAIYAILIIFCTISRMFMAREFIVSEATTRDLCAMYFYGFLYDSRTLSIALMIYFALILLFSALKIALKMSMGGGIARF